MLKEQIGHSSDVVIQAFDTIHGKVLIVYIDGITSKDLIDRDIIAPMKSKDFTGKPADAIKSTYKEEETLEVAIESILSAFTAVFFEGLKKAFLVEFRNWEQRSVEEPTAESVIRGPKEGFTENIRVNTALIRRKLKTPKLTFENITLGKQTNTTVNLVYIQDIVNQTVLKDIKDRISRIDYNVDSVLETGYIEQLIDPNRFSPVSGIGLTQKPDKVVGKILEGRVAILCDGTPHALLIPELFIENIQTAEDYYNRVIYASLLRLLRLIGLIITVILPGFAIAIFTYNREMLPSEFLVSIIGSTLKTPMPIWAEILLLTILFELLREAGTRLPKAVGSAITIVGSLIIGEAAVNAGIVSEVSVIIVALTAVTSFMVPNLFEFVIIYRLIYWIMGTLMGIIGIGAAAFISVTHLMSTKSFGIPILSSFSKQELKDSFVRFPRWSMIFRPISIAKNNRRRVGKGSISG